MLRLGDAVVVEAGEAEDAALTTVLALADPTEPNQLAPLTSGELLGPGELFYVTDRRRLRHGSAAEEPVAESVVEVDAVDADGELAAWLLRQPDEEVEESSAAELDRAFVLRRDGAMAGVAGWVTWPTGVAHLGVLTDARHRGAGVATTLGSRVVLAAIDAGLTPQWRAARWNRPSMAVATRIGLTHVGRQLSAERVVTAHPAP